MSHEGEERAAVLDFQVALAERFRQAPAHPDPDPESGRYAPRDAPGHPTGGTIYPHVARVHRAGRQPA